METLQIYHDNIHVLNCVKIDDKECIFTNPFNMDTQSIFWIIPFPIDKSIPIIDVLYHRIPLLKETKTRLPEIEKFKEFWKCNNTNDNFEILRKTMGLNIQDKIKYVGYKDKDIITYIDIQYDDLKLITNYSDTFMWQKYNNNIIILNNNIQIGYLQKPHDTFYLEQNINSGICNLYHSESYPTFKRFYFHII